MNKQQIIKFARELRKKQTPAEKLLWIRLRNRKLDGYKFLRQHPIAYLGYNNKHRYFIPDFFCIICHIIFKVYLFSNMVIFAAVLLSPDHSC